jgi:hypothetical protein
MRSKGVLLAGFVSSLSGCHIHLHVAAERGTSEPPPNTQPPPPATPPKTVAGTRPIDWETAEAFVFRTLPKEAPAPAAPAPADEPPLDRARSAYVRGDYVEAMRQAVRSNLRGWAVVGASACATGDREWIGRSWSSLSVGGRRRLQQVCGLYGHALSGALDSDRVAVALGSPSED